MAALDRDRVLHLAEGTDPDAYLSRVTRSLVLTGCLDPVTSPVPETRTPVEKMFHRRYLIDRHVAQALAILCGDPPDTGPPLDWYLRQSQRRLDLVLTSTSEHIGEDDPMIPLLARSGTPLPLLAQRLHLPLWKITTAVLIGLPEWREP